MILSLVYTMTGCAAIAAIPIPLRILSNLHTGVTVKNNLDDDPNNNGWVVDALTGEQETIYWKQHE